MSTQAQFPASTLRTKHGFFESFPRELRDKIYIELSKEVKLYKTPLHLRVSIPVVSLRLVSRQAKREYDEISSRAEHMSHLAIMGGWQAGNWDENYRSALTARTTNIKAELPICFSGEGCAVDRTVHLHAARINGLIRDMPNLRRIRATMTVAHANCFHEIMQSMECITALPRFDELVILRFDLNIEEEPLATWTKQKGLVYNAKVSKHLI